MIINKNLLTYNTMVGIITKIICDISYKILFLMVYLYYKIKTNTHSGTTETVGTYC